jgi:uncharacterized protein (DUF1778 family)
MASTTGKTGRDPFVGFRLPPTEDKALRAAAEVTGQSLSELIRDAIKRHPEVKRHRPTVAA